MGKHIQEGLTSTSGLGFVVDEDNMASNSATKIPTQQSVKAYADKRGVIDYQVFTSSGTWNKPTGATDATSTNSYFYVDDFNVAYPAGHQVNLGNLDLWADGLPVAPALATMPSLQGVWDEPLSAHTVSGSFGWFVKKLLTVSKFLGLK